MKKEQPDGYPLSLFVAYARNSYQIDVKLYRVFCCAGLF